MIGLNEGRGGRNSAVVLADNQVNYPLHMVWLGGPLPLRATENLHHICQRFETEVRAIRTGSPLPYMPTLWLDLKAWSALTTGSNAGFQEAPPAALDALWLSQAKNIFPDAHPKIRWVTLDAQQTVPVLIYEEMMAHLETPWLNYAAANDRLRHVLAESALKTPPDDALMGCYQFACMETEGVALFRYAQTLIDFISTHWRMHGLLCMASDLLRLLLLTWRPGAYVDIGDVAGRLAMLPSPQSLHQGAHSFVAHVTIAIENDLIFCNDAVEIHAITIGTLLWSVRSVKDIANRLHLDIAHKEFASLAANVLPVLNQMMPRIPEAQALFVPPYTVLADYINAAYGSTQQLFGHQDTVQCFTAGQIAKDRLINHVGGFTGYQRIAYLVAPQCQQDWCTLSRLLQLEDYAPQLGWKTYGFGTIDRLIHLGSLLNDAKFQPDIRISREINQLDHQLFAGTEKLCAMAMLASTLYEQLERHHHNPSAESLKKIRATCEAVKDR